MGLCSVLWAFGCLLQQEWRIGRGQGGLVLFFLLVLFVSPDFFEGRTEGVLCSHGFHESFGEGEVKEKLERYC